MGNGLADGAKNVATNGAYGRTSFTAIVSGSRFSIDEIKS